MSKNLCAAYNYDAMENVNTFTLYYSLFPYLHKRKLT